MSLFDIMATREPLEIVGTPVDGNEPPVVALATKSGKWVAVSIDDRSTGASIACRLDDLERACAYLREASAAEAVESNLMRIELPVSPAILDSEEDEVVEYLGRTALAILRASQAHAAEVAA